MSSKVLLLLFLAISSCFMFCNAGYKGYPKYKIKKNTLKDHFYRKTCPNLEEIVQTVIERHVLGNPNLPAKLIRMQFHDCFVRVLFFLFFFIGLVKRIELDENQTHNLL